MYRQQQDASAGAGQQYQFGTSASPYGYAPFSGNMSGIIGHNFHSNPQHLSPRPVMPRQPSHSRHASIESQRGTRAASRSLSPGLGSATPSRTVPFTPMDRSLPSKDVSPETITDAFVSFILYCNPNFPLDVDTTTLRTNFQSPPKSDNKDFETYRLFELLQKFDSKEIKTWLQLALELGVEAPDVSKGQSVQKVQQYTVRLKRWMRANHVDAFFEYLLGKDHSYFTEIPHPNEPYPSNGRDGVVAEEDLAIRALDPAFRPKRGRRRNSDAEQEFEAETASAKKQPRLMEEASHDFNNSSQPIVMMPFSARPENSSDPWAVASAVTPNTFAPWANKGAAPQSAVLTDGPSHFRWQVHGNAQNPVTPHPMTAHPSSIADNIDAAFENEPKSAITPSARKRRKHGPAVSSAWPSAGGSGAKPRGRPPASRSVQDGPFSTFPADPGNDRSTGPTFTAPVASMESTSANEEEAMLALPTPTARQSEGLSRPGRLSLQVPARSGGPVRLATPPRVLVNGEMNDADDRASALANIEPGSQISNASLQRQNLMLTVEREIPGFAFEALKRVLASDLLRADLTGRRHRLNGDEAKRLADAVLERFNVPRADTDSPRDDIGRLTAASWLGVGDQLNVPLGPAIGQNKRVTVTRFRIDDEGYEEIVSAYDDNPGQIREVFDLSWTVTMGGCNGIFELKGLSLNDPIPKDADIHDRILDSWYETVQRVGVGEDDVGRLRQKFANSDRLDNARGAVGEDGVDWKSKYRALEFGMKMAKGEFDRFRHRAIEKVLDALI